MARHEVGSCMKKLLFIFVFIALIGGYFLYENFSEQNYPRADLRFSQTEFRNMSCRYPTGERVIPKFVSSGEDNVVRVAYDFILSEQKPFVVFRGTTRILASVDGSKECVVFIPSEKLVFKGDYGQHRIVVGALPQDYFKKNRLISQNPFGSESGTYPKITESENSVKIDFATPVQIENFTNENVKKYLNPKYKNHFPNAVDSIEIPKASNSEVAKNLEIYGKHLLPYSLVSGNFSKDVADICKVVDNSHKWDSWKALYESNPEATSALIKLSKSDFDNIKKSQQLITQSQAKAVADKPKLLAKLFSKNQKSRTFAFVYRNQIKGSFFAYTEALSDARSEATFAPDSHLCVATIYPDGKIKERVLLSSKDGVIRDPDVSYDGKKILFSWKKNPCDDFHIYQLDISDVDFESEKSLALPEPKQLTFGRVADTEAVYMPNGEIVFSSTRCENTVSCYTAEVSNMYMMKNDGSFLRRVAFDQVHTSYPQVLPNGDVIYMRWDYNDRGQIFTQSLFTMKQDGSFQTEYYGNKSWFPVSILHARGIPNSEKVIGILSGHHTSQRGKLAIIDIAKGNQEGAGVHFLAPKASVKRRLEDLYGQLGEVFMYPFAFSEDLFLVSYAPDSYVKKGYVLPAHLYLMDSDGSKLCIAKHKYLHALQAVEIAPRKLPVAQKSTVDYSNNTAELFVRNIYNGYATSKIPRGKIAKLRIVKPKFNRRYPVGKIAAINDEGGVKIAGGNYNPIGLGHSSWDAKEVVGEVPVDDDGSVHFKVPSREPLYFQVVDVNGNVAVTMRSWASFQGGEFYSCAGCHGQKSLGFSARRELVKNRTPKTLKPFYDVKEFSFRKHIQPILNEKCISCHNNRDTKRLKDFSGKALSVADITPTSQAKGDVENVGDNAFSLLDVAIDNKFAKRYFNDAYYNLLCPRINTDYSAKNTRFITRQEADFKSPLVNWIGAFSVPNLLPAYYRGSATSKLVSMLKEGHSGVELTQEQLDKISCWIDLYVPFCASYEESANWSNDQWRRWNYYLQKAKKEKLREEKAIATEIAKQRAKKK